MRRVVTVEFISPREDQNQKSSAPASASPQGRTHQPESASADARFRGLLMSRSEGLGPPFRMESVVRAATSPPASSASMPVVRWDWSLTDSHARAINVDLMTVDPLTVNGHLVLPNYGHGFSPLVAIECPHWWPSNLPTTCGVSRG